MAKSKAQLEAENELLRTTKMAEGWVSIIQTLIRWGGFSVCIYFVYLSISALAGRNTEANVALNFLANFNVSVMVAWTVAASGVVYGKYQEKLRKDAIERLQERIKELELAIDPQRSSSNLTPRGNTRPEDRP